MKRVVTGHDAIGTAIFISRGEPQHKFDVTALGWRELWATFPEDALPHYGSGIEPSRHPRWKSVYPETGQSVLPVLEYCPDEVLARGDTRVWNEQEIALLEQQSPNMLASLGPDATGTHTTNSVDYGIVLSGRIGLELDDGVTVELEAGDGVYRMERDMRGGHASAPSWLS